MKDTKRFIYETRPIALEENIVTGHKYRFTVLTPMLIRLEYSPNGCFEDRASQFAFFRDFPINNFSVRTLEGWLTIETSNLLLVYKEEEPFAKKTLSIKLKTEPASTWFFDDEYDDLGGTARTLDRTNGSVQLDRGVCSQYGFSIIDDCNTVLLNDMGWVEVRQPQSMDYYFFGYGYEYKKAVKDLYRLTGAPPMLPAYALGNWWSRYYAYTQDEYQDLILRFEMENIPFSVAIVDMDWHVTKIPTELKEADERFTSGWTGYSWNKELFPDYRGFLKFIKEHNLKTALNLHPAQGVGCHEDMYEEMATACGIDPATKERVKFDVLSPEFMEHYFDILHHPYEEDGVNFWWMDWQQGTNYWWINDENRDEELHDERELTDPLWFLNHLHCADIQRNGVRPMFLSRYSGPGSHRYPVGFSGDTTITWEALEGQPKFTATASNIGYSWWSHDIGGHMRAYQNDELMVRWVQYGVFSPINRLHSANEHFSGKEPWNFGFEAECIIKDWLRFRHYLFPYIYTMNYRNYKDLEPLIQPMYYAYPKRSGAYEVKNQFMFGSELMVAPITKPNDKFSHYASTKMWLPEGDWFDFFTGLHYTSKNGRLITISRPLKDYPVFAKAGAIIPLQTDFELRAGNDLDICVYPGAHNKFTLYEDAGEGAGFKHGEFVLTEMILQWSDESVFIIRPAQGDLSLLPPTRSYNIKLRGWNQNIITKLFVDGREIKVDIEYDEATRTSVLALTASVASEIKVVISGEMLVTNNGDIGVRCEKILRKMEIDYEMKLRALEIVQLSHIKNGNTNCSVPTRRIAMLYHELNKGPEYNNVIEALKEQLILTDESHYN